MDKWGFKPCMITLGYDPFQSVNHGVPGSSPGEGAIMIKRLYFYSVTFFMFYETKRNFTKVG